jgi:hypothetical protein
MFLVFGSMQWLSFLHNTARAFAWAKPIGFADFCCLGGRGKLAFA